MIPDPEDTKPADWLDDEPGSNFPCLMFNICIRGDF